MINELFIRPTLSWKNVFSPRFFVKEKVEVVGGKLSGKLKAVIRADKYVVFYG